jgi:hypothetical protein
MPGLRRTWLTCVFTVSLLRTRRSVIFSLTLESDDAAELTARLQP